VGGVTWKQTASHILCKCVALAELRFLRLGKHFVETSDYDEIPLCGTVLHQRYGDYGGRKKMGAQLISQWSECKGRLVHPPLWGEL
jgi:hypothetical protein